MSENLEYFLFALGDAHYCPGFYKIGIDANFEFKDFEVLLGDKKLNSIFIHEYVHYLQDITTYYGLLNSLNNLNLLFEIVRSSPKIGCQIPLEKKYLSDLVRENNSIRDIAEGCSFGAGRAKTLVEIIDVKNRVVRINNKEIEKIEVQYTSNGKCDSFIFGANCIRESMAYIAQASFQNNLNTSYDLPYRSSQKISKYLYPTIGNNDYFVFALCDISLMTQFPALFFVETLKRMYKEKYVPQNIIDIYKFLKNDIKEYSLNTRVEELISFYNCIFSLNNETKLELEWLSHILSTAVKIREKFPHFLTYLLEDFDRLPCFVKEIGLPLIENISGATWSIQFKPDDSSDMKTVDISKILVIRSIIDIFLTGKKKCILFDFCAETKDGQCLSSEICKTAPWENQFKSGNCSFLYIWRLLGLENVNIK